MIASGFGFYYDSEVHYLVQFSDDPHDWSCAYKTSILTVPPLDNPLFDMVYEHEKQHAILQNRIKQNVYLFLFWNLVIRTIFFSTIEELWVSYQAKGLKAWITFHRNWINLILFVVVLVFYGLLFLNNFSSGLGSLIGYLFADFFIFQREKVIEV